MRLNLLVQIMENPSALAWLELVETTFEGIVSKAILFSHELYQNSYHAGQIGLVCKNAPF